MKRFFVIIVLLCAATFASAQSGKNSLKAGLDGYSEVPAISTTGSGQLRLRIVDETAIDYELSYENLEGTVTTASHVHLGQTSVNGGIMFFLCGGGGRPDCTAGAGSFTGTVTAANILGPSGQGVEAAEFAEVLNALRAGAGYVNVHTNKHPGGEIRGQIKGEGGETARIRVGPR